MLKSVVVDERLLFRGAAVEAEQPALDRHPLPHLRPRDGRRAHQRVQLGQGVLDQRDQVGIERAGRLVPHSSTGAVGAAIRVHQRALAIGGQGLGVAVNRVEVLRARLGRVVHRGEVVVRELEILLGRLDGRGGRTARRSTRARAEGHRAGRAGYREQSRGRNQIVPIGPRLVESSHPIPWVHFLTGWARLLGISRWSVQAYPHNSPTKQSKIRCSLRPGDRQHEFIKSP